MLDLTHITSGIFYPNELSKIPNSFGVYIFFADNDVVLYVGKSNTLRTRIQSYFRKKGHSEKSNQAKLRLSIQKIIIIETDSELLSLLVEDRLIKYFWPPFNKQQKKTRSQGFLKLSNDEFPIFIKSGREHAKFGPFKDHYFATEIVEILQRVYQLRQCGNPIPTSECIHGSLHDCSAPCVGKIEYKQYLKSLEAATTVLAAKNIESFDILIKREMEKAAEKQNFELAAKIRDNAKTIRRYFYRQQFYLSFISSDNLFFNKNELYYFHDGELVKMSMDAREIQEIVDLTSKRSVPDQGFYLEERYKSIFNYSKEENFADLFDRSQILYSWLNRSNDNYHIKIQDSD